jgi:transketolase
MPFEDVGMMRLIPNLTIIEPCDTVSCAALVTLAVNHKGSMYIRMHRKGSQTIYNDNEEFTLGKGKVLQDGNDITLIASGFVMVPEALEAAKILKKEGIKAAVIDMHTIKPLDDDLVLKYAKKTHAIVTCENHQVKGGLGGAVAELLSEQYPTYLGRIGSKDRFGQVGTLEYLMEDYHLTAQDIVNTAHEVLNKKKDK